MSWRQYALLFVVGLIVPFAVSRFQSLPGYMDADYYFAGGVELAKGNGFTEPYLWNYLTIRRVFLILLIHIGCLLRRSFLPLECG